MYCHCSLLPFATIESVFVQSINPLDPLVQTLVQDKLFIASVQTGQLHAAAAAAVKVFRSIAPMQPSEFKRPADRRLEAGNGAFGRPRYGYGGAPTPLGPAVRSMKQEVLQLEDAIPWTMVRRTWRNKRATWRRQVKQTELVADFAARLKELRISLLTDEATFIGCGPAWRNQLDACLLGRGAAATLASVWDEMKNTIRSWLIGAGAATPSAGRPGTANGMGVMSTAAMPPGPQTAARAVQALHAASFSGDAEALLQIPLEAICGNDTGSLHAVRQAVELERRIVAARLAAAQNGNGDSGQPASYFGSISAAWEDSEFDSGGDSEMEIGSDATDLDSDFDA
jgi:hypothetical protein